MGLIFSFLTEQSLIEKLDEDLRISADKIDEFSKEIQKKSKTIAALAEEKEALLKEKALSLKETTKLQKILYGKKIK